jgi:hypothetical protein
MKRLLLAAVMALVCAIMIVLILPVPADAACKSIRRLCQQGECENMCITTSDGGPGRDNMYTDGRRKPARFTDSPGYQRYREQVRIRARQERGRREWANDGTPSAVGIISPFVPGSTQDLAWKDERRRRGVQ